jgi:cell division septal protein FtsQ
MITEKQMKRELIEAEYKRMKRIEKDKKFIRILFTVLTGLFVALVILYLIVASITP